MKTQNKTFLGGVLVLTLANVITKIIGLVFKIPLTNMLGNEGMGYFNTAYQIYTWLYMLSTAGVPVALSMMISESDAKGRRAETKKLFRLTILFFTAVGLLGSALMLAFCKGLASFISADKAFLCILAIAPALFFVCISSTVRGFFQGKRNMLPTAVSEIIESALKLTVGILLGYYALNKGYELYVVAAYAILGVTVGVGAGAAFLSLSAFFAGCFARKPTDAPTDTAVSSSKELLSSFFKIAIPVMLSSSLLSMSSMFDTLIVIRRLQDIGIAESAAVALYGNYTAYCVTLFNLPPVLIYPIVNTLLPTLSAARVEGDSQRVSALTERSLKFSAIIALPCAVGLGAMSLPILKLIFTSEANAEMAAPLLTCLAPSIFLIGIMAVTNGLLQAFTLQKLSLISMLCGAAVKGLTAYLLPALKFGNGYLGIYASPISTFLFYLTITVINVYFLASHAKVKISPTLFLMPLLAAAICGAAGVTSYALINHLIGYFKYSVLISIGIAAIFYLFAVLILGVIRRSDIALVPKLERITLRLPLIKKLIKNDK